MKKILTIIGITSLLVLTACSSKTNTPNNIEDLYDLFLSDDFNNVTISNTDYNNIGVASTGKTIKVDGENYHIVVSRDEDYYYSISDSKSTKYTQEDGEWKSSTPSNVEVDKLAMNILLYDIIPSSIDIEDFIKEDGNWIYESITNNTFNTKVKTYILSFTDEYVELKISEETTTSDNVITTLNIKDTKIYNFGNTKVLLPEIE